MDKELINEIRRLLNFMEEFDSLVAKAKKESDAECEEELYGHLSAADERLRDCVGRLLGDVIGESKAAENAEYTFDGMPYRQQNQE